MALGWLLPQETSQRTLNGHGLWVTINLAWDALAEAKERLYEPVVEQAGGGEGAQEPARPAAETPAELSPPPAEKARRNCHPHRKTSEPLPKEDLKTRNPPPADRLVFISLNRNRRRPKRRPTGPPCGM